jgi:hypothetical protein
MMNNQSGTAVLGVMLVGSALTSSMVLVPALLRVTADHTRGQTKKFQLQNESREMHSFLNYPDACKRVLTDLVRIEDVEELKRKKRRTYEQVNVSGSIRRKGSLKSTTPSNTWTSPGPTEVVLGEPLFKDKRLYRATLFMRSVQKLQGVASLRAEEIPVYIAFADNGTVSFCEATSISQTDKTTFEDRVCRLQYGETTPDILYDPLSRKCRSAQSDS